MKKNLEYKTKDFYSACLLRALHMPFNRVERGESRFVLFVFDDTKREAEKTIAKYWNRKLPIEAKDLVDAIHDMKSLLYAGY